MTGVATRQVTTPRPEGLGTNAVPRPTAKIVDE